MGCLPLHDSSSVAPLNCLVTGANGFIGSRLMQVMSAARGIHPTGGVRLGKKLPGRHAGVVIPDMGPQAKYWQAVQGIDVVVHLAGRAHTDRMSAVNDIAQFRRVNTAGTLNLARQAADAGVARFVYMSSVGVNGRRSVRQAFKETDSPNPEGAYALSKAEAEEGLRELSYVTPMEVVIIRPPLVYGPNAPGNFGRLQRLIRTEVPLPFGRIQNRRSLVAIDNLVNLILTCISHPAAANETFLISDGEDLSTTQLIRRMAKSMNCRARLLPVPQAALLLASSVVGMAAPVRQLVDSLFVDASKAQQRLSWAPPISVDEGLRRAAAARSPVDS